MQIKLIKPAMNRGIGTVLEVNDDHGRLLIDKGYAILKPVEMRSKAIASADTKTIDSDTSDTKELVNGNRRTR